MSLLEKLKALLSEEPAEEPTEPTEMAEESVDEPAEEPVEEPVEGTLADVEAESPEMAELRETIVKQAAEIETLRNQIAALGGETVEEIADDEDPEDDAIEDDAVAAFDSDYDERKARLAAITEGA